MTSRDHQATDKFIALLTENQPRIRGYIMAALGDFASSQDVLQKTNLTIWDKAEEFRPDAEFLPWAIGIARYQILAYFRDKKRERLTFCPELSDILAGLAEKQIVHVSERQAALRECLRALPGKSRLLINQRYGEDRSLGEIGQKLGKSVPAVKGLLFRIRSRLADCIEWRLRGAASQGE